MGEVEHARFAGRSSLVCIKGTAGPGLPGGCGQEAPAAADGGDRPRGRIGRAGRRRGRVWPMRSRGSALSGCRDTGESNGVLPLDANASHGWCWLPRRTGMREDWLVQIVRYLDFMILVVSRDCSVVP